VKAILDTNIVLDVLLERRPFAELAAKIFALAERSEISAISRDRHGRHWQMT